MLVLLGQQSGNVESEALGRCVCVWGGVFLFCPALPFTWSQVDRQNAVIVFFPWVQYPLEVVTQPENQTNRKLRP